MNIFAIADLHLSLRDGRLTKPMDCFGERWADHHERIAADWTSRVAADDLVLLPGDLSWAMRPAEATEDLAWLEALPGRKVILKGNHDYWMPSRKKLRELLPASLSLIQHDAQLFDDVVVFGSRLWNVPGLQFPIAWTDGADIEGETGKGVEDDAKLLNRELERLKLSIAAADRLCEGRSIRARLCMLHFPPTDPRGTRTRVTELLEPHHVSMCVYGHVHNLSEPVGDVTVDGTRYRLVSCDALGFRLSRLEL